MASGHAGDAMDLDQAMIVAGVGCKSGASAREIEAAIGAALSQAGVANGALGLIATSSAKAEEPGLAAAAADRGLKFVFVPQADLEAAGSRTLTHSERVLAISGVPSVSEAAALAAAGPGRAAARAARRGRPRDLRARGHGRWRVTVHFIGAGPGAADLITVRGRDLIARCPVCLYAGSIVPKELLQFCPPGARIVDTAPMSLDEIEAEFVAAHGKKQDVARLHSGDLSIYSALAEQTRRLDRLGIPYTLTPGVPAFAAAAAVLGRELTVPEMAQSVVLTRMPGRASAMPEGETLAAFAATGATLVIHLAIQSLAADRRGACSRSMARNARSRWWCGRAGPDERILRGTLGTIRAPGRGRADRAHRAGPGRAGARRAGFPRKRAVRSGLSPPVSRRAIVS